MRHDLGANAILQWCDDLSTSGVVFRVCREHQQNIELQPDWVSFNLHISFLHDVEKTNLNLAREVGKFVNRKDASVSSRQQTIMNRQLIAEKMAALRGFNRIYVANDVRYGHIRCGEFFDKPCIAVNPIQRGHIAMQLEFLPAIRRDGLEGIIVNFGTGDHRNMFVEQAGELANDPALRLPTQTQQN